VIERLALALCPAPSVNCTANDDVLAFTEPVDVGVPEIEPVLLIRSPAGNAPAAIAQRYGSCPPDACSCVTGYAFPTVPTGSTVVVITGVGCAIVNESFAVAGGVPCESDITIFSVNDPDCVGVPLISPPVVSTNPAGSSDELDHR
jgi:hypothetical protein